MDREIEKKEKERAEQRIAHKTMACITWSSYLILVLVYKIAFGKSRVEVVSPLVQ